MSNNQALKVDAAVAVMPSKSIDPLDVRQDGKTVRQHLKEFGALFGTICFIFAAGQTLKGRPLDHALLWSLAGATFAVLGYFAPRALRPVWAGWMKFAHVLGLVMTTVILTVLWSLVMLPTALALRIVGRKVMDLTFKTTATTYWEKRTEAENDFKLLQRQF